MKIQEQCRDST